ncbi:hypothetical protein [Methylophaga sp.]|uniref:hypothetical protein n=1 Tax=Methylophaga sp. TaxID=2024840 RepID=UPI003A8F2D34
MMKLNVALMLLAVWFAPLVMAEDEAHKECLQISSLTGDYFAQRLEGKTKAEMQQATPSEFKHTAFLRKIELAINLAFTFPESQSEEQIEKAVYENCLEHRDN